ncbi:hypothetical protein OMO38_08025 [Chryseobacterium sp. 09-1422]|jgi:hypothetical protein|uniref:Uncharacterized protein n=1 Tax=Chryseobacterium kimseyorum TaxID=2984028 RepID=A0ABT3HXH7_9FLAO|nr:hypothetical protein [Chryseobacterium kimseyorum]MCW3168474.1 hypothetical protein [Chryseobacterium kimseyorum]
MISGKKIYYVPGLISALLIPVLFWYFGNQRTHSPFTIIELGIPAKVTEENFANNTFERFRNWNYKKIVVKPNTAIHNQLYYRSELKKLQQQNIKETGIEFVIEDKNTCQDFIALIDAMTLAKQETYGVDMEKTGHFFAVHIFKDSNEIKRGDDTYYGNDFNFFTYKESDYYKGYTKFRYQLSQLPKEAFYLLFSFLIFLNISIFSIKERFSN